jgi:hypothetical protein
MPKPEKVQRAIFDGNWGALSAYGKKGAKSREKKRLAVRLAKEAQESEKNQAWERRKKVLLAGAREMAIEANEHICPVD